ncbi:hypothetical protein GL263_26330 [Streptomyces durbertensis]|uniref:Uncharacterized protein n=1 Tax=Streptomyces durbertensis TaxID=2448886 RepID=A0ABR6EPP8_9ACTN|nr:hypothetical protein [Streptomyces durbertensis]MBB1247037.1 hypothetical protein [Streptomyces durbertensis]
MSEAPSTTPDSTDDPAPQVEADSEPGAPSRALVVAAEQADARRVIGRIPPSARTPNRPKRSRDELLAQARTATADWPDEKLTANAIRLEVRTSAENARTLRDTLRAERESASVG